MFGPYNSSPQTSKVYPYPWYFVGGGSGGAAARAAGITAYQAFKKVFNFVGRR